MKRTLPTSLYWRLILLLMACFASLPKLQAQGIKYSRNDYVVEKRDDGKIYLVAWKGDQKVVDMNKDFFLMKVQGIEFRDYNTKHPGIILSPNVESLSLQDYAVHIDFSHATNLKYIGLKDDSYIEQLDISNCKKLEELHLSTLSNIKEVDTRYNTALKWLYIDNCPNISQKIYRTEHLPNLYGLFIFRQSVEALDLTHNPKLTYLHLELIESLEKLDLSKNSMLTGDKGNSTDPDKYEKGASLLWLEYLKDLKELKLPVYLRTYRIMKGFPKLQRLDFRVCKYAKDILLLGFYFSSPDNFALIPDNFTVGHLDEARFNKLYTEWTNPPRYEEAFDISINTLYVPSGCKNDYIRQGWNKAAKNIVDTAEFYIDSDYEISKSGRTLLWWKGSQQYVELQKDPTFDNVDSIAPGAFSVLPELLRVRLPRKCKYVGNPYQETGGAAFASCPKLFYIDPYYAPQLKSLSVKDCPLLIPIEFEDSPNLTALRFVNCPKMNDVDLTHQRYLEYLYIKDLPITTLNLNNCWFLRELYLHNTSLAGITWPALMRIETLAINGSKLKELDLSMINALTSVTLLDNQKLEKLDISALSFITQYDEDFVLGSPNIKEIRFPASLKAFGPNALSEYTGITSLDLTSYTQLTDLGLNCFKGIDTVKLSSKVLTFSDIGCKVLYWFNTSPQAPVIKQVGRTKIVKPNFDKLYIPKGSLASYKRHGWDKCTKELLEMEQAYDPNSYRISEDGLILYSWVGPEKVINFNKDPYLARVREIHDISTNNVEEVILAPALKDAGIVGAAFEDCPNLKKIDFSRCQKVYGVGIRNCPNLKSLDFQYNKRMKMLTVKCDNLATLKLPENGTLETLDLSTTKVIELDSVALKNMRVLDLGKMPVTSLDLSHFPVLYTVRLESLNQLTSINFGDGPNNYKTIFITACTSLKNLDLSKIKGKEPIGRISECPVLKSVIVPDGITELYEAAFEDCPSITFLNFSNCTKLKTIGKDAFRNGPHTVILPYTLKTFGNIAAHNVVWKTRNPQPPLEGITSKITLLYVPKGTKEKYVKAGWDKVCINIVEENEVYYNISTKKEGEGTISSSHMSAAGGTEITITVTPAKGWSLKSLKLNGEEMGDKRTFILEWDSKVEAIFEINKYAITSSSTGEGEITINGFEDLTQVPYGTKLTVKATPEEGWELTSLKAGEKEILSDMSFVVEGETTVTATFTKKQFAVTSSKKGEGTISITGAEDLSKVTYGTNLTVKATPATGWNLQSITVNGKAVNSGDSFTVTEKTTVAVVFVKQTFAVTTAKTGQGSIALEGFEDLTQVPYGTKLTVKATPEEGWELTSLKAGEKEILSDMSFVVEGETTVTATFTKKQFAVTSSKKGEGTISITGAEDLSKVAYGTKLTVKATPATGWNLQSITVNGKVVNSGDSFTVTATTSVVATFTQQTFTVTSSKKGEGTISITGAADLSKVAYGTKLTVKATPATGWNLQSITVNGKAVNSGDSFTVTATTSVVATFTQQTFTVTSSKKGEGTISITGAEDLSKVAYGTKLTVKATPATGWNLQSITVNGKVVNSGDSFTVTATTSVVATFTQQTFTVTSSKKGEGTISITGAADLSKVAYGTKLTVKATPATGWNLQSITVNGKAVNSGDSFTVTATTSVVATFTQQTFAVTSSKKGEGTISITGAEDLSKVAYGTKLTVKATPATGWNLQSITVNGKTVNSGDSFTVTATTTVVATFTQQTFTVTINKTGEGSIVIKKDGKELSSEQLKALPYGSNIIVEATPAKGWQLTALTANGKDVIGAKSISITQATTIVATFTQQTFAVTINKTGEGTVEIKGAEDLTKVPYGTELTVNAQAAEGWELAELTANGKDILADKKFVVTEATTLKALFKQKTDAQVLTAQQVKIRRISAEQVEVIPPMPVSYKLVDVRGNLHQTGKANDAFELFIPADVRFILILTNEKGERISIKL